MSNANDKTNDVKIIERFNSYFTSGGLFNPELMDHQNVSKLLTECRDALNRVNADHNALRERARLAVKYLKQLEKYYAKDTLRTGLQESELETFVLDLKRLATPAAPASVEDILCKKIGGDNAVLRRQVTEPASATKPPNCPKCGTKMKFASGDENYHDLKHPHWRCELWVGSGVCGRTLPLVSCPGTDPAGTWVDDYDGPMFKPTPVNPSDGFKNWCKTSGMDQFTAYTESDLRQAWLAARAEYRASMEAAMKKVE